MISSSTEYWKAVNSTEILGRNGLEATQSNSMSLLKISLFKLKERFNISIETNQMIYITVQITGFFIFFEIYETY